MTEPGEGGDWPRDEMLAYWPDKGDLFSALCGDSQYLFDGTRERAAKRVDVQLTDDERRRLRVGGRNVSIASINDVFFARSRGGILP